LPPPSNRSSSDSVHVHPLRQGGATSRHGPSLLHPYPLSLFLMPNAFTAARRMTLHLHLLPLVCCALFPTSSAAGPRFNTRSVRGRDGNAKSSNQISRQHRAQDCWGIRVGPQGAGVHFYSLFSISTAQHAGRHERGDTFDRSAGRKSVRLSFRVQTHMGHKSAPEYQRQVPSTSCRHCHRQLPPPLPSPLPPSPGCATLPRSFPTLPRSRP
jgi:hypothetical protein